MSDANKLAIDALEQATEVGRLGIINAAKHGLLKKARESRDVALAALRAQPDHIVDASGMVDHSELVKRLKQIVASYPDGYIEGVCREAADALEAIGETK